MKQPLLSIVIPTKDRYFYLKYLIELIVRFDSDEIEIVIQDNTYDNSEILKFLEVQLIPNLKYFHTKDQIPISLNTDKAILNSTGKYICFIGDDDGLTSDVVGITKLMDNNGWDVLRCSPARYIWPDKEGRQASLKVSRHSGNVTIINVDKELRKLMGRGFIDTGGIPMLYHGIASRSLLDRIYMKCGTFFPGPSPDIANAVAISLCSPCAVLINYPIIFSGVSKHHNGGGYLKKKARAVEIDTLPFLPADAKRNWETCLPRIWTISGELTWCNSAIKALRNMGRNDMVDEINFEYLYAKFIAYNYSLRELAWNLSKNKPLLLFRIIWMIVVRYVNALVRKFKIRRPNAHPETVLEATNWIDDNYKLNLKQIKVFKQ